MSLKSKLAGLERRLGVTHCPHCRGALIRHPPEVPGITLFTDEDQLEILHRLLTRWYDRESILALLASM
jgi:hypothetical protein